MKMKSNADRHSSASLASESTAGPSRMATRLLRPARARFWRATAACFGLYSSAVRRLGPRQPDAGVTAEGADFENPPGANAGGEDVQEHSERRGDGDRRESGGVAAAKGLVERRVVGMQECGKELVDARPGFGVHGLAPGRW
jgi:hypothetical protein